jgi:glycine cleavage system regulatory protein
MLVMTIIGQDRPGLVDAVAAIVGEHGGNWLESRMSRLGGQFAGILRVEVPAGQEPRLVSALNQLEASGLTIVVAPDPSETAPGPVRLRLLEIIGQDRPGIVRQISRVLAHSGVNIEELHTECGSAAMTGEALFKARATLRLPAACDIALLRQELEKIAADLIVDVSLADVDVPRPHSFGEA